MRELGRLLAAVVLLTLAGPAVAAPTAAGTVSAEQVAVEKTRAEKAERDLAIQTAVRESEDRQNDRAFSSIESMIGVFGVLITVIVIFFALRTEGAAAAAATAAAREELTETKTKIDDLKRQAEAATVTAEAAAAKASEAVAKAEAAAQAAAGEHDKAKKATAGLTEVQRQAMTLLDSIKSRGAGDLPLTKEQTDTLVAAANENADVPEKSWTIERFKTAIGKAMFVDRDWIQVRRLAIAMARTHEDDREALIFAHQRRGDAERALDDDERALAAYDQAIAAAGTSFLAQHNPELLSARYHRTLVLSQTGHLAEAETELLVLLPACKKALGVSDKRTLTVEHALAACALELGRAEEAEKLFRALLPIRKKVEGSRSVGAYITASSFALATLETGNADAAARLLRTIPYTISNERWSQRYAARLAYIRSRVSEARGRRAQAKVWLSRARDLYAIAYPPDHYQRHQFDAYLASRPSPDTPDA